MSERPRTDLAPQGRRRDRAVLALAVSVVVGTVVLLCGAEWLAKQGAQSVLAQALQERTGALEPPTVDIRGGPVLIQALRGRYEDVQVSAEALSSGPLRIEEFSATLSGVHLSFHDLLHGTPARIVVGSAVQGAVLRYEDLNRYLGFTGRSVEVAPTPDGGIRATGQLEVRGAPVDVSTRARITTEDGAVVLQPTELRTDEPLDGLDELLAIQRFTVRVPLEPLPFGQRLTEIRIEPEGIVVEASTTDVEIGS
jgi:hypothetical protein